MVLCELLALQELAGKTGQLRLTPISVVPYFHGR